jgi:DNA mismatch endonuclease (patch repair protein)
MLAKTMSPTSHKDAGDASPPPTPTSWATNAGTRRSMQANRSRDTKPELALRRALHALGHRYRVGARPLHHVRRSADLVFTRKRIAVFVDGCFWHGCPEHHRAPSANSEYWSNKINRNRQRDTEINRLLESAGWTAVRIWEHTGLQQAVDLVVKAIDDTKASKPSRHQPMA